jgi:hypothetical protein
MNKSNPSLIPLQRASLCLDCEVITPAQKSCLACGSAALLNVARALSRPQYAGIAGLSNPAISGVAPKALSTGHELHAQHLDGASGRKSE